MRGGRKERREALGKAGEETMGKGKDSRWKRRLRRGKKTGYINEEEGKERYEAIRVLTY